MSTIVHALFLDPSVTLEVIALVGVISGVGVGVEVGIGVGIGEIA